MAKINFHQYLEVSVAELIQEKQLHLQQKEQVIEWVKSWMSEEEVKGKNEKDLAKQLKDYAYKAGIIDAHRHKIDKLLTSYIRERRFNPNEKEALQQTISNRLLEKLTGKGGDKIASDSSRLEYQIYAFCNDEEDLQLLQQNSYRLLEKYQAQIASIVKKLIEKKGISTYYYDRILDDTKALLFDKLVNGKLKQYRKGALVRTFLYKVFTNASIDVMRKHIRQREREVVLNTDITAFYDKSNMGLYAHHYGLLLNMLFKKEARKKMEFCVKTLYLRQVTEQDITQAYPITAPLIKEEILQAFGKPFPLMALGEVWKYLLDFVIVLEDKKQGLTYLKSFVEKNKYLILETLLETSLEIKDLSREAKNALDEFFELVVYKYYTDY